MESQPKTLNSGIILKTFTHVYIFNILHKLFVCVNVLLQQSTILFSNVGLFLVELVLSGEKMSCLRTRHSASSAA